MADGSDKWETCRSVVQFLLSRPHYRPDERSEFTVAVRGSFAEEARRAFLKCRQAVFQFLVLCPKRLSRDVCKLICAPLLRTWLDDCTWFSRAPLLDVTVALMYDSPKGLISYYTNYVINGIVQHLKEVGSTYKENQRFCFFDPPELVRGLRLVDADDDWLFIGFAWGNYWDVGDSLQMRGTTSWSSPIRFEMRPDRKRMNM